MDIVGIAVSQCVLWLVVGFFILIFGMIADIISKFLPSIKPNSSSTETDFTKPNFGNLFPATKDATKRIKTKATKKYGDDDSMAKHEVEKQIEAYHWLLKQDKYPDLMRMAIKEWKDDYIMVKSEYEKLSDAKREYKKLGDNKKKKNS